MRQPSRQRNHKHVIRNLKVIYFHFLSWVCHTGPGAQRNARPGRAAPAGVPDGDQLTDLYQRQTEMPDAVDEPQPLHRGVPWGIA